MLAAKKDMIGFAVANGPSAIPPTGGKKPLLGTNPVSVAIPAKNSQPLVLDFATSAVARGKVALAKKNGEKVPEGWGLDKDGKPTTEPNEILDGGSMLPMAGAKGYGIALVVEIFASCLSGALNGQTMGSFYDFNKVQNSGFAFGAIDISKIADLDEFKNSVEELFADMKNASPIDPNKNIMIPGEIEYLKSLSAIKDGVNLSSAVEKDLMETAVAFGVPFPNAI
jgi:LDH2 family malate/lactate/ureidoglycolate dehydrogenase